MHCHNCSAPNPAGATHCHRCRMPGDFGQATVQEAKVVAPQIVDCHNCGGHAPAQAAHCPTCRWPLPMAALAQSQTLSHTQAPALYPRHARTA